MSSPSSEGKQYFLDLTEFLFPVRPVLVQRQRGLKVLDIIGEYSEPVHLELGKNTLVFHFQEHSQNHTKHEKRIFKTHVPI